MKKRYMISTIGAIGAGALASYLLKDKESRAQVKEKIGHYIEGFTGNNEKKHSLLEDAGIPDQVDHQDLAQFENAKMVSEGSQDRKSTRLNASHVAILYAVFCFKKEKI